MKKSLAVLAMCCVTMQALAAPKSQILKLTEFTAKQRKAVDEEQEEGSGDALAFATDKGVWWIYVENRGVEVLEKLKIGDCMKVTDTADSLKGKYIFAGKVSKVKCPR